MIAGALCGPAELIDDKFVPVMRSAGMSLSPFNAWVVLKGWRRCRCACRRRARARWTLARWLEAQPAVERVYYPGLASHPQHALAMAQQSGAAGRWCRSSSRASGPGAFAVIDATRICSITANLGDTKTTITHPASTSHGRLSEAQRQAAGITQGLIRVAVGLEDVDDIKADLARGLAGLA